MKIYTKTGDNGKTSLFGGKRVSKTDLRIEVYGEIDELSSVIGVVVSARSKIKDQRSKMRKELIEIQKDLFEICSIQTLSKTQYLKNRVSKFENLIDEMDEKLPRLNNFILPGGGKTSSLLHLARSVCRRVERRIVQLAKKEKISFQILAYFNRLSDLLFVMARFINHKEKQKEIVWRKK